MKKKEFQRDIDECEDRLRQVLKEYNCKIED